METAVLNLHNLYDKMRSQVEVLNEDIEPSKLFMFFVLQSNPL